MKRFTKLLGSITLSTALVISSLAVTPDSSVAVQAAESNDSFEMTDSALFQAEYVNGVYTITGLTASTMLLPSSFLMNSTESRSVQLTPHFAEKQTA